MKAFLLFVCILFSGCQPARDLEQDTPIFFADVEEKTTSGHQSIEITFNRDLSEVVNGVVEHGFGWISVEVENPTLNGMPLKPVFVKSGGVQLYYVAEIESPPLTYDLAFSLDGKSYKSDDSKRENRNDVIRIPMGVKKQ